MCVRVNGIMIFRIGILKDKEREREREEEVTKKIDRKNKQNLFGVISLVPGSTFLLLKEINRKTYRETKERLSSVMQCG